MKILSILIVSIGIMFLGEAQAYEPAMLKSTGEMIDEKGKVIAVLNQSDVRNNEYEYYYSPVDEYGTVSSESKYILTSNPQNPLGGFVKYDISKKEFPAKPEVASSGQIDTNQAAQQPQESNNGMVKSYGSTVSYNNADLNKARYDQDYQLKAVYK